MNRLLIITIAIFIGILAGCSHSSPMSVAPDEPPARITSDDNTHMLWGLWEFKIDSDAQTLDFAAMRTPELHLNTLPFLEPPPLVNLALESVAFNGNIVEVDIGLRHPFLGLNEFTGFDVCGVLITRGSISGFIDDDLLLPGDGDLRLLNPDGYTRWWNPSEFPVNDGTILSYTDGLLGTPDSVGNFNATLNGYKYFCDELNTNDPVTDIDPSGRGIFSAGQKNIRHYTIQIGDAGLMFNYAVDASWQFPPGGPPYDVPDDFPPGANRREAWNAIVGIDANTLWNDGADSGGGLDLAIDVYDWFDAGLNTVTVESPGNFNAASGVGPSGGGTGYSTYEIEITSATPAPDEIELLITVESEQLDYGGLLPGKAVSSYFMMTVPVSDESPQQGIHLTDVTPPGWPATLNDVWVDGDYAYCSGIGGLLILDVSGTGDATYVGGGATDGGALELQVDGDYCYIADGSSGLVIFDVSDPSEPEIAATIATGYSYDGIHVVDGICYAAEGKGGVTILDVGGGTHGGSPDDPQLEGSFSVAYAARDIFVVGGIAYVADYETRFLVLDVGGGTHGGSPANPQWEGELASIGAPDEIFVHGSFAFCAYESPQQILVLDIMTPSNPWLIETEITSVGVKDLWHHPDDDYLFTVQGNSGLVIYQVSKSGYLDEVSAFNTNGYASGVCYDSGRSYVADYYDGLKIFDVSPPEDPTFLGKYFTPCLITDLQVVDGYVYTADGTCGLAIVDVGGGSASPEGPLCVSRETQPSGDTDSRGIWVEDGYAYVGGGFSNYHLSVVDVGAGSGTPENPSWIGDDYHAGNRLYGMQKMGDYLYAASYTIDGSMGGLETYDVDGGTAGGSPTNPKRTSTAYTCTTWELWAEGGYVYIACGQNGYPSGLYVYDAGGGSGAPNAPSFADSFITEPDHLYDVNVVDGYAYCAGRYGLYVYDVGGNAGAPNNIIEAGSYYIPDLTRGIGVAYGHAFLVPGQSASALIALDVGGGTAGGTPEVPVYVDDVLLPAGCDAFCVAFEGQYAYVGTHSHGLRIIRLWD